MKPLRLLILSVVSGIATTLLTGMVENTPEMLVGAVWYGYPLAWLVRRILSPQYFPWVVRPLRFSVDTIFWIILAGIILFGYTRIRSNSTTR